MTNNKQMVSSFARFRNSVGNSVKSLFSLRSAAVAAAGIAGLGLLSKRSIDAADNIGKTARAIDLSAEALQELRFAASRGGVDVDTFDKAMLGFSKRVGEARQNTGSLVTILRQMSPVLLEQIQSAANVEEAFNLIVDAADGMGSALDRNALLAAAFGRSGVLLTSTIKGGTKEIDKLREASRRLGLVLSDDIIAQSEIAADELGDMGAVIKVAGVNLGLKFMPAMRSFAGLITDPGFIRGVENVSNLVSRLLDSFRAGTDIGKLRRELAAVDAEIETLEKRSPLLSLGIAPVMGGGRIGLDTINGRIEDLEKDRLALMAMVEQAERDLGPTLATPPEVGAGLVGQSVELTQALTDLDHQLKVIAGDYDSLNPGTIEAAKSLGILANGVTELGNGVIALSPDLDQLNNKVGKLGRQQAAAELFKATRTEAELLEDQLKVIGDLYASGDITGETQLRAAALAWENLNGEVKESSALGLELGQTFGSAFEEAVLGGGKLSDVLKGLEQDLLRIALRRLVTEPIFGFLGSLIPAFATGGSFTVGGSGGTDANLVAFKATRGEQVSIKTPGQQAMDRAGGSSGGGVVVSSNVIVNVHAPAGSSVSQQESTGPSGRTVDIFIDEMVAGNIGKPGSRTARALRDTMGASKVLRGR